MWGQVMIYESSQSYRKELCSGYTNQSIGNSGHIGRRGWTVVSALLLLTLCILFAPQLQATTVTGTIKTPTGSTVTGYILISLPRSTVHTTCTPHVQVVVVKTVKVLITDGIMAAVELYPTSCLSPSNKYVVEVYDDAAGLIYATKWTVPNQSTADVTQLEQ